MNMQESPSILMGSPLFSPSSDERFWSALRNRIDALLEERNSKTPTLDRTLNMNVGDSGRAKRLKEDALLLIRGFDSVAHTLSQLSNNLDTALQGANDLAKPPTLIEIFHNSLKKPESESESKEENSGKQQNEGGETNKGLKRKYDHCSDDQGEEDSKKEREQSQKDGKLKKAKNLAISMATKAASHAWELKSIKSDLCFMQERCSLLEKENRRLRDGFSKGIRPEEDDLVRLQLEALLAEKSRLANENANLIRENQCLNQLVEYHQLTSQEDFSNASYEQVIQGLCLDFSSPPPPIPEEEATDEHHDCDAAVECFETPVGNLFGFSDGLNEYDDHHLKADL